MLKRACIASVCGVIASRSCASRRLTHASSLSPSPLFRLLQNSIDDEAQAFLQRVKVSQHQHDNSHRKRVVEEGARNRRQAEVTGG